MENQREETIFVGVPSLPRDELVPHKSNKDEYKLNNLVIIVLVFSVICIGCVIYIGIKNEGNYV